MLSGKRFRLKKEIIAIETIDGRRTAVTIPSGSVVLVTSGPTPTDSRMIDIIWTARHLVVFGVDILERGEEVSETAG